MTAVENSPNAGAVEQPAPFDSDRLWNADLAPAKERPYGSYSLVSMWMSDVPRDRWDGTAEL